MLLLLSSDVGRVGMEALAVGSLSMTIGRSRLFREMRWWIARHTGGDESMCWDLIKCPWCLSHWFSLCVVALGGPVAVTSRWGLDFLINWLALVALAPLSAFFIHRIYGALPPVPTETEWNEGE